MIRIIGKALVDDQGTTLKTLSCPMKVSSADFQMRDGLVSVCRHCDREIVNTDYLSEAELIALVKRDSSVCLRINRLNPVFQIEVE